MKTRSLPSSLHPYPLMLWCFIAFFFISPVAVSCPLSPSSPLAEAPVCVSARVCVCVAVFEWILPCDWRMISAFAFMRVCERETIWPFPKVEVHVQCLPAPSRFAKHLRLIFTPSIFPPVLPRPSRLLRHTGWVTVMRAKGVDFVLDDQRL